MALIPPFFLDSVVAIGEKNEQEKIKWIGTGFIVGRQVETDLTKYHTFLVTNKHIFDTQNKLIIRFNPQSSEKVMDFDLPLTDEKGNINWTGHPDQNIDVAAITISPDFLKGKNAKFSYFRSDKHILKKTQLLESGISEGDFIYTLGFPMGIVGDERNYVIVKSGIIARIKNYYENLSKEILIDSSVFPGNSGGPVINKPEFIYIENTKSEMNSFLIGMIQSSINYQDVAFSAQTNKPRLISVENSGLTVVIPTDFILETIDIEYSKRVLKS